MDAPSVRHEPTLPLDRIAEIRRRRQVAELAVFGSILGPDFGPDSDIDFLAAFQGDDVGPWGSKYHELVDELSDLLHRKVDLVSKRGVERNRNWMIRNEILRSARVIHGP